MDIAFKFRGDLFLRNGRKHRVHQQQKRASAVERRERQHIHDGQIDRDERAKVENVQNAVCCRRGALPRLRNGRHNADRPGHVIDRHKTRHQIAEAHPHEPRKIQRRVPRVFEHRPDGLFLIAKVQAVFQLLLAVDFIELLLHFKVVQFDEFPVPLDDKIEFPRLIPGQKRADVGVDIHAPSVDLIKLVADLKPLFDTILEYIPAPEADVDAPFQMLVSAIDYNEYVGRMAIGRIERGTLKQNQEIMVCNYHDPDAAPKKAKAVSMYEFEGLGKNPVTESTAGNIICLSGIGDITIGDTICAPECVEPLPFVKISAPTMEMTFSINDSPYAGREGKFVTSRQLRDRLFRETLKDVSLRVTELKGSTDAFNVAGRGEMSLSILIETMRREGYEFQVSPPRVLYQMIDGKKCEPIERLVCDVPQEYVGAVIEKLGSRKGDLAEMTPIGSRMKLEFLIPARGLFGYRNEFLTDTKGEGIMASVFDSYAPYKGELARRNTGSLVASETGTSITYGLFNAQERGVLFIGAGVDVYEGMVVGQSPKQEDITVNVCKKKQLTNMRASGSDDALRLVPPKQMSLEQCLEFLADDELLEVTPKNLRIRKTILNKELRMKATHGNKKVLQ